jgi:hypothetical protein
MSTGRENLDAAIARAINDKRRSHPAAAAAWDRLANKTFSAAARDVLAERQRQVSVEGWATEHDTGAMAAAAACYCLWACAPSAENAFWCAAREEAARTLWPWDEEWWKPSNKRRDLIKAAALILAEIERFDRAAPSLPSEQQPKGGA